MIPEIKIELFDFYLIIECDEEYVEEITRIIKKIQPKEANSYKDISIAGEWTIDVTANKNKLYKLIYTLTEFFNIKLV